MNLTNAQRTDTQMELEAHSVQLGIARYNKALEDEGITAVAPGMQLIKAAMKPMIEATQKWLDDTGKGLASRNAGVYHFINQLPVETLAWLTASAALQMLHDMPALARVALSLSASLEGAVNLDAICAGNPALGKKVKKSIEKMGHDRNKLVFIRKAGALSDTKVIKWDDSTRARVGTQLVHLFAESTGLVALETVWLAKGKSVKMVRPTEACMRWLEEAHARCELMAPVRLPMVCMPRDWTQPFNGGYLTHSLRQPLVKTRNKGYLQRLKEHDMPWVYASVNTLQATEWSVNLDVLEVARTLWEACSPLAGMPLREDTAVPAKNWTPEQEPAPHVLHAWKVDAAKVHEANSKMKAQRLQVNQKFLVAEMMIERGNRFHYVYNVDWRGRMYPVGPALTPQGDDLAKGMLQFSRGAALGDEGAYWLAVHGANTFGVDKVSFAERIQWVEDHTDMILECARHPFDSKAWADADSPFCFLAFCLEWAKLQELVDLGGRQEDFVSHIAVAFDGACNGLQNFSAMLRDPVGGAATGLVPRDTPSDIYSEVARAAQAIIDRDANSAESSRIGERAAKADAPAREGELKTTVAQRWVGKMTRKLAKRNTMTVPYGVTGRGMRDQLYKDLADSAPEHRSNDADYLAACNYTAIGEVVVAARQAMDWLRDAAKVAASTELPVSWTTPAGFLAVQDYREDIGEELDFVVMGQRYRLLLNKAGDKLNTRKQALGISPNFVHSLDAAHLMRTVLFCAQDGVKDFAMIHDSYGVHAANAGLMRDNLRQAFVEQYSEPVLEKFRDELAAQLKDAGEGRPEREFDLPELPPMGDLDLEQVRQSEYFFA